MVVEMEEGRTGATCSGGTVIHNTPPAAGGRWSRGRARGARSTRFSSFELGLIRVPFGPVGIRRAVVWLLPTKN